MIYQDLFDKRFKMFTNFLIHYAIFYIIDQKHDSHRRTKSCIGVDVHKNRVVNNGCNVWYIALILDKIIGWYDQDNDEYRSFEYFRGCRNKKRIMTKTTFSWNITYCDNNKGWIQRKQAMNSGSARDWRGQLCCWWIVNAYLFVSTI